MKPPATTKRCIDCKRELPVDSFYRLRRGEDDRQARCKPCDNAKRGGRLRRGDGRIVAVRQPDGSITLVRVIPKTSKGSEA